MAPPLDMRGSHALTGRTSRPCPGPVTGDPTCCRALSGVSGCELCPRKCAAEGRGAELGPGLRPGAGPSVWEGPRPAALGSGTKADDCVPNDGKHTGPEDQEPFYCKTTSQGPGEGMEGCGAHAGLRQAMRCTRPPGDCAPGRGRVAGRAGGQGRGGRGRTSKAGGRPRQAPTSGSRCFP